MNAQYLTLVRHAKSSWQSPGQADHDRPLNERGRADAPVMAQRLIHKGCIPDHIVCSSARRTQETAACFSQAFNLTSEQLSVKRELYLATPELIILSIRKLIEQFDHVMVIGHNPGMEDLCALLDPSHPAPMPTLAIRHFTYSSTDQLSGVAAGGWAGCVDAKGTSAPSEHAAEPIKLIFDDFPKKPE